jgi:ribose transport system permease protein
LDRGNGDALRDRGHPASGIKISSDERRMNSSISDPAPSAETLRQRSRRAISIIRSIVQPFVVLLIVVIVFMVYGWLSKSNASFLTERRMPLIAKQTAIVGLGALGMTVIIIGGGIDLSVGSMMALASVSLALALRDGWNPAWAVLLVMVIGTAAGALNGILITALRLVPFIVTLGTMQIYRGLAEQIANREKIAVSEAPRWLTDLLRPPAADSYQRIATGAWIVVVLAIALAIVMRYSVFGRHVFAIGSNEATARLCGINVARTKIVMYALGGFFMALAGVLSFANLNSQGDPTVVIGGGSLSGGRGSVVGSIVGALTMTTLKSGCDYAGVGDSIEKIIIGGIIIAAVAVDQLTQSRMRR